MTTPPPPPGGRSRASIYDVADRAGVSHMTVSRVLNDHPNIRESTRERVLQAMGELNYTRSTIARALATKRTMRIGALVDAAVEYGPASTLRAVEHSARRHGYAVSAFSIGEDEDQRVDSGIIDLLTQGIDALCVIAPRATSLDRMRQQTIGVPTLIVMEHPTEQLHTVSVDQRGGAQAAIEHLIELGHSSILHLAGPLDWYDAQARESAWRETLTTHGLPVREPGIGDWSADSGYEYAKTVDLDGATAIFAANDQMALGVMHGLHERGLRVPDDVSVVGFDDLPDARHFLPPLTTVQQDFVALGELIMSDLLAAIDDGDVEQRELIAARLVVRESTAPLRSR